jgi:GxxExxY protein
MANHEAHEDHEGNESTLLHSVRRATDSPHSSWLRMRLPSPLSPEAESVMTQTIGCAIAVHRTLGPGFLESIYRRAMYIELGAHHLAYEAERPVKVVYRGVEIPGQRVDLIVEGLIVVEIKSVMRLDQIHRAQLVSYLKTTGLRGGLLMNFRAPTLRQGLQRIVL